MSKSTKVSPLFISIAVVALSIGVFTQFSGNKQPELPEFAKTIILPKPKDLNDAAFIDHRGQAFGLEQMRGKWSILFFGFTNCPDICPTTMQTLGAIKKKVSEAKSWGNYQVIMVSVDPERDTTERLANYVPYFDPEFIGLSSDVDSTAAFAKQLGILFVKRDVEPLANAEPSAGNEPSAGKKLSAGKEPTDNKEISDMPSRSFYDVDHSASIILINPQGQWAGVITAPHKAPEISQDLIKLAEYADKFETQYRNDIALENPSNPTQKQSRETLSAPVLTDKLDIEQDKLNKIAPSLSISNAWIRPAPPVAPSMAAYFELINNSNDDVIIVEVQSTAFSNAMIHSTEINDGVASMQHIDELIVPANSRVVLKPLGLHMMLMQPREPLGVGESAEISLTGSNEQVYTFTIPVQAGP